MIDPAVCVPTASGTWKSATAAADPDDDPPGVCSGWRGLRVFPGPKKASSVVTVLPSMMAPAALSSANDESVSAGSTSGEDRRSEFGRKIAGVDDVLDADRDSAQRRYGFAA